MSAILDMAEQLFAQHGIEKISLRDLATASGQRNVSAVAYHFGTREGLLSALLARRLAHINQLHMQRLQLLIRLGKADDPHAVIGEAFRVTSEAVRDEPWGANFVAVVAQVLFHPELDMWKLVPAELFDGIELAKKLVRPSVPDLSEAAFGYRADLAHQGAYFTLAMWVQKNGPVTAVNEEGFDAFVESTVDFLVGGVTMPAPKRVTLR